MRKRALILVLALVALLGAVAEAAGKRTISIRNQKYTGKTMWVGKELWLPLDAYAKAMRLQLTEQGKVWCLSDPAKKPTTSCPTSETTVLCVNGALVPEALMESRGAVWVSARAATKALGGKYVDNPGLGMLDILMPYVPPPDTAKLPPSTEMTDIMMVHFTADW